MLHTLGILIGMGLQLYLLFFFVRMIMSWIPVISRDFRPTGPLLVAFEAVYTVTDPPIQFFDRFLPAIRAGGVSLSLGFMAAMLAILILVRLNSALLLR